MRKVFTEQETSMLTTLLSEEGMKESRIDEFIELTRIYTFEWLRAGFPREPQDSKDDVLKNINELQNTFQPILDLPETQMRWVAEEFALSNVHGFPENEELLKLQEQIQIIAGSLRIIAQKTVDATERAKEEYSEKYARPMSKDKTSIILLLCWLWETNFKVKIEPQHNSPFNVYLDICLSALGVKEQSYFKAIQRALKMRHDQG